MLNLRDMQSKDHNHPWLIAHRGGVVSPQAPENSLAAIRLASEYGYHMVELDVREARDHVPMLFHGIGRSSNLYVDCGIDQDLEHLTSYELSQITYRLTDQPITKLTDAFMLCAKLNLGVMLDIKAKVPSDDYYQQISDCLIENRLESSAMTLSHSRVTEQHLKGLVCFPLIEEQIRTINTRDDNDLQDRFYFEWGSKITAEKMQLMHEQNVPVIAAINYFHYPRHAKMSLAEQDIRRLLKAGVDGFQIDDEYRDLIALE